LAQLAIESALSQVGDGEVIVADNSDIAISVPSDPRLRVLRTLGVLSMPDNWERALRSARGDWIILLADKYRLAPGVLDRLLKLTASGERVITYAKAMFAQNIDPDQLHNRTVLIDSPGELVRESPPPTIERRDGPSALRAWFDRVEYQWNLPMLYNAIVHRSVIDQILATGDRFFFGSAPDVASGLRLASSVSTYLDTTIPLILVHSPTINPEWSGGTSLEKGGSRGNQFLNEFRESPLRRHRLPPTVASVILETLLEFQSLYPELTKGASIRWDSYSRAATREIEGRSSPSRWTLHLQVFLATAPRRYRTKSLLQQLRVIGSTRFPEGAARLLALRDGLTRQSQPKAGHTRTSSFEPSMALALQVLCRDAEDTTEFRG
jgi:hypothetical protein